MKTRLSSLILVLCITCSLALPVGAANSSAPELEYANTEITPVETEEMLINDAEFLSNAVISEKSLGNDVYAIELRSPKGSSVDPETGKHVSSVAALIAFSKEELTTIEQNVRAAAETVHQKPKDNNWEDFGHSLYLESIIFYTLKYVSGEAHYKMDSVRVKYQVRDGTSCIGRSVKFVCNMAEFSDDDVVETIPNSAGNPYTVNAPYTWQYVSAAGLRCGAFFYCTVQRPGGENDECSLYNDLFP